jgi:hypothetical protein
MLRERTIWIESDRDIEKEMSEGMVVGTMVNAILAYMSLYHFEEAMKCCEFILDKYC